MIDSLVLSQLSVDELAAELARRKCLDDGSGFLPQSLWELRVRIGPVVCVDGIPVRRNGDSFEALAIRRATGPFAGKLCPVGGVVNLGEGLFVALRRHFQADLGVGITPLTDQGRPVRVGQWGPFGAEFQREPTKHAVGMAYLVHLDSMEFVFGTKIGGREAGEVLWISKATLPSDGDFGYDHHYTFRAALAAAEKLS